MSAPLNDTWFPESKANTLGALQNGVFISIFLFGVATLQIYYYLEHHSGDGPYAKRFAITLWFLLLIHTIAIWHFNYYITITVQDLKTYFSSSGHIWSVYVVYFTCASIDLAIQVFYGLRLKLLSRRWELTVITWILALAQFGLTIELLVVYSGESLESFLQSRLLRSIVIAISSVRFVMDSASSSLLSYYMARAEVGDRLCSRKYVLLFIDSGMLCAAIQLAVLVSAVLSTENFVWIAITFIRSRVLANSVLLALNSRHLWRGGLPLVDLGKKPFFPTPQPQRRNELQTLDIRIEKSHVSSAGSSMTNVEPPVKYV